MAPSRIGVRSIRAHLRTALVLTLVACFPDIARAQSDVAGPDIIRTPTCTPSNLFSLDASLQSLVLRVLFNDPKQGFEAARFLSGRRANPIHLAVAYEQRDEFPMLLHMDRNSNPNDRAWAYYSQADGKIRINHVILHQGQDNEEKMIRDPQILEHAIETIAGTVVHEVSHARDAAEPGGFLNSLETEIIAHYRETFYLLDTAEKRQLTPSWIQASRTLRTRETIEAKVRAFKERARGSKNPLSHPPELDAAVDAFNKELSKLPQITAQEVRLLLDFERGNTAFEDSIATDYPIRSRICTDDGLLRARDGIVAARKKFADLDAKLRKACARLMTSDCPASIASADKSVAEEQGREDELMAPEPRGHICGYYARLLDGLRKESTMRRVQFRPLLDQLAH